MNLDKKAVLFFWVGVLVRALLTLNMQDTVDVEGLLQGPAVEASSTLHGHQRLHVGRQGEGGQARGLLGLRQPCPRLCMRGVPFYRRSARLSDLVVVCGLVGGGSTRGWCSFAAIRIVCLPALLGIVAFRPVRRFRCLCGAEPNGLYKYYHTTKFQYLFFPLSMAVADDDDKGYTLKRSCCQSV